MRAICPPPHAAQALAALEAASFEAWYVGGCVRDSLLGLAPGDWDIATNAAPEQTEAALGSFPTVGAGVRYGTVTALVQGQPVEITTYRAEGRYTDHRRPDSVRFAQTLEEDLARRDFTVNALAYHPRRGLVDRFGGLADLEARRLRCVGDPDRRFREDALRLLRGPRFLAALGFSMELETDRALRENRALLKTVSGQRVREEMTRLLVGPYAERVLREYREVLFVALPELAPMDGCAQETPYHRWDVWEHTIRALAACPPDPLVRWAALLHDCGKPAVKFYGTDGVAHFHGHAEKGAELAAPLLDRLRFPRSEREKIVELVRLHGTPLDPPDKRARRLLAQLGPERLFRLLDLKRADSAAHAPAYRQERILFADRAEALARELLARREPLRVRDLAVNGDDLLALGIPEGPEVGRLLRRLLDQTLDGALPNERQALLEAARTLL